MCRDAKILYLLKVTSPEHDASSILMSWWRVILGPIYWSFTSLLEEALFILPRSNARVTVAALLFDHNEHQLWTKKEWSSDTRAEPNDYLMDSIKT